MYHFLLPLKVYDVICPGKMFLLRSSSHAPLFCFQWWPVATSRFRLRLSHLMVHFEYYFSIISVGKNAAWNGMWQRALEKYMTILYSFFSRSMSSATAEPGSCPTLTGPILTRSRNEPENSGPWSPEMIWRRRFSSSGSCPGDGTSRPGTRPRRRRRSQPTKLSLEFKAKTGTGPKTGTQQKMKTAIAKWLGTFQLRTTGFFRELFFGGNTWLLLLYLITPSQIPQWINLFRVNWISSLLSTLRQRFFGVMGVVVVENIIFLCVTTRENVIWALRKQKSLLISLFHRQFDL